MSTKRFVKQPKFERFVLNRYTELNEIQGKVLSELNSYAGENNLRLSRAALGYLFDEIQGDKAADIPAETVLDVLQALLSETEKHKRNDIDISQAVLVRALREYNCPRPWC
ncbi:MAG: hypothetical protein ACXV74_00490 [Methylobacter sp.]